MILALISTISPSHHPKTIYVKGQGDNFYPQNSVFLLTVRRTSLKHFILRDEHNRPISGFPPKVAICLKI